MKNNSVPPETFEAPTPQRPGATRLSAWFVSDWLEVVFFHFRIPVEALQPSVPFELDCRDGQAYVSLVSFEMRGIHPAGTGALGRALFRPWRHQRLLNLRTYVRFREEPGIYFLKEWINDRLNAWLGPKLYGLPYCLSQQDCSHCPDTHHWEGRIEDTATRASFEYSAAATGDFPMQPVEPHSLPDFLVERYAAFTEWQEVRRVFRIDHAPWLQCPVQFQIHNASLLEQAAAWWGSTTPCGAQASPGVRDVRMGAPERLN